MSSAAAEFDGRVRLATYRHFVDTGAAPSPAEVAVALASAAGEAQAVLAALGLAGEFWRLD